MQWMDHIINYRWISDDKTPHATQRGSTEQTLISILYVGWIGSLEETIEWQKSVSFRLLAFPWHNANCCSCRNLTIFSLHRIKATLSSVHGSVGPTAWKMLNRQLARNGRGAVDYLLTLSPNKSVIKATNAFVEDCRFASPPAHPCGAPVLGLLPFYSSRVAVTFGKKTFDTAVINKTVKWS